MKRAQMGGGAKCRELGEKNPSRKEEKAAGMQGEKSKNILQALVFLETLHLLHTMAPGVLRSLRNLIFSVSGFLQISVSWVPFSVGKMTLKNMVRAGMAAG